MYEFSLSCRYCHGFLCQFQSFGVHTKSTTTLLVPPTAGRLPELTTVHFFLAQPTIFDLEV
jgi:hypothetical protein